MDRQIQKLQNHLTKYMGKSKTQMEKIWGTPISVIDGNIWIYHISHHLLAEDKIFVAFSGENVSDIYITEYFMKIPINNIFYYSRPEPHFIINSIIWKRNYKAKSEFVFSNIN
ncbi:hypothetical protein [Daejeonia sp. YH14]|uniref:hypothetical protein n=1 Tax=Daejeonia sp. YH14 TaxID=3439042 RepID=UPI003F493F70